jgi:transposase
MICQLYLSAEGAAMLRENYYRPFTEVDQEVFTKSVPDDHYLRKVKALIDFEAFRERVRDAYSPTMGRPAEDPVLLIKLCFLEIHYGLSDREVIAQAQVNTAFRYFLDLSLNDSLPDPSLLSQFRARLGEERFQVIFQEVIRQAREHGLIKNRLRLKDATHVVANIAVPSAIELVEEICQLLLEALSPYAPEQVEEEEREAERIRDFTSDLRDAERLYYLVEHLRQIVTLAEALVAKLGPASEKPDRNRRALERALTLAHKVLRDREDPKAKDRLRSVTDPDARQGKHGNYFDGYLVDALVDYYRSGSPAWQW